MEAQLKPQVLDAFDAIAKHYKKLQKTQEERLQAALVHQDIDAKKDKAYQKLKHEMVGLMEAVHLNNGRIEFLVENIYGLNKRLMILEGRDRKNVVAGKSRQVRVDLGSGRKHTKK